MTPIRTFALLALLACVAPPAIAQQARHMTVTGKGSVEAVPDLATITLGVSHEAETAEAAMARLAPHFGDLAGAWTSGVPLPGGDFPVDGVAALVARLVADYPFLAPAHARRLVRAYGTEAWDLLGTARAATDLGQDFGATLTACEVEWLMAREYARTAEDVVWRRSKLGLRLGAEEVAALEDWMADRRRERAPAAAE